MPRMKASGARDHAPACLTGGTSALGRPVVLRVGCKRSRGRPAPAKRALGEKDNARKRRRCRGRRESARFSRRDRIRPWPASRRWPPPSFSGAVAHADGIGAAGRLRHAPEPGDATPPEFTPPCERLAAVRPAGFSPNQSPVRGQGGRRRGEETPRLRGMWARCGGIGSHRLGPGEASTGEGSSSNYRVLSMDLAAVSEYISHHVPCSQARISPRA